jgi:dynein heavy chain
MVAELETRLVQMQPVLERASVDASELLIQVARDQGEADVQAAMVARDVEAANKVAAEVKTIKDDSQADLDEAMPAYEAAVDALKQLDKKALQELKAFTNPPEMVKFTMEAVCILFDKPPDWGEAKKLLAQMDLLEKLAVFDKDNIHPKIIKKLQKYYNDPRFVPDEMKKISNAAMSLCMWSRAMVTYDRVAKSIEPRKEALRQAEESLEQTLAELDTKREGLRQVLERVAGLQRTLLETEQRKSDLQGQAELAKQQLVRAGLLIGGLGGEKKRWEQSAMDLSASKQNLVGDMALAAGFIAYLGPFTAGYRTKIIAQWQQDCVKLNVPCSDFSSSSSCRSCNSSILAAPRVTCG